MTFTDIQIEQQWTPPCSW